MNTSFRPVRSLSSSVIAAAALLTLSATVIGAGPSPVPSDPATTTCWTDQPGTVGSIDHPTDPEAIILRMLVGGGFVPVQYAFMENPTFTLYGNDVAIFRSNESSGESTSDALRPFACAHLTPDQVDELLSVALDDGGLRGAKTDYPNPFIVDVPSTTFTIDADGVSKTVAVQGLGFDDGAPNQTARVRFNALADTLKSFQAEVGDPQLYDVPTYRGMLTATWPELEGTPVPWPWGDISPADFGTDLDSVELTPEEVGMVTTVPSGGQAYILLESPDGTTVALTITPVLPTGK